MSGHRGWVMSEESEAQPPGRKEAAVAADTVEFGSTALGRRGRRGAGTVVAALLLIAVLIAAVRLHDAHQTLSQAQFLDAITTFRPEVNSSDVNLQGADELAAAPLVTEPEQCHLALDVNPPGALGAASWTPATDPEGDEGVQASRYADPAAARRAFTAVRRAVTTCHQAIPAASDNQSIGRFTVTDVETDTGPTRHRLRYTLRFDNMGIGPSDGRSAEFTVTVLRYGNALVWNFRPTEAQAASQSPTEALVHRMRTLTR